MTVQIDEMKFRRLWRDGVSYNELRSEFGVGNSFIRTMRQRLGLPKHVRRNSPSRKYDVREMRRLRESGMSVKEISRICRAPLKYVYELLKKDDPIVNEPRVTIPDNRIELRDRLYELRHRDLTGALQGDPLPGRRELLEQYA